MPIVRGVSCGGFADDAPAEPACHGAGVPVRGTPPPPPRGGPNLLGLFPKTPVAAPVPSGGFPWRGLKSDQPPGSLCAPPHGGHNSDPGGGKPTVPQVNLV